MRSSRLCPVPPCPINTSGLRPDAAVGCHNTPGMACQPRSTVNPRSRTPEAVVVSSVHCGCLMPVSLVNVRLLLHDLKPAFRHHFGPAIFFSRQPLTHFLRHLRTRQGTLRGQFFHHVGQRPYAPHFRGDLVRHIRGEFCRAEYALPRTGEKTLAECSESYCLHGSEITCTQCSCAAWQMKPRPCPSDARKFGLVFPGEKFASTQSTPQSTKG